MRTRCKASCCRIPTRDLGAAGLYTFAANVKSFRDISLFCSVPAQVGNQALAAECAASYLLFYPTDEPMLEKMKQYRTELGEDTAVTAREVVTTPGLYFLALPCPIRWDHSLGDKKGNVFHCRCVPGPGLKKLEPEFTYSLYQAGSLQDRTGLSVCTAVCWGRFLPWVGIVLSFVGRLFDSLFASLEYSTLCAEIFDGEEVDLLCSGASRRNF